MKSNKGDNNRANSKEHDSERVNYLSEFPMLIDIKMNFGRNELLNHRVLNIKALYNNTHKIYRK